MKRYGYNTLKAAVTADVIAMPAQEGHYVRTGRIGSGGKSVATAIVGIT